MRTCEEYEALISAFIDGALEDGDWKELMDHMAHCPNCQAYFDDQIAIHDALQGMEAQAPADFTARVMEQVRREPRQAPAPEEPKKKVVAFPYWRRFAALAACCAVVAIAGLWAFGGRPDTGNVTAYIAAADSSRGLPAADGETDVAQGSADAEGSKDTLPDTGAAAGQESDQTSDDTQTEESSVTVDAAQPESPLENGGVRSEDTPPSVSQMYLPPADGEENENGTFPAMYSAGDTATLTTASQTAAAWVEENLGQTWVSGASYTLTEEQFAQVKALLEESGESFTEALPSGNSLDGTGENQETTYMLQAAP